MSFAPFSLIIEAALRAILAALVVWAGLRLLRVGNVLAQKTAWALVLAAAVAMPLLMRWQSLPAFAIVRVPLPLLRPLVQTTAPEESAALLSPHVGALSTPTLPNAIADHTPIAASGSRFPAPAISIGGAAPSSTATFSQALPETVSSRILPADPRAVHVLPWQSFAGFLFIAMAAALILRVVFGLATACRLWFAAEPVPLDLEQNRFPELRLRWSSAVASPVTVGSAVLLPADYVEWDADKLRIVLAHERSHIRQGDFYLQLLAALYAAVFWFSPLGWWLKNKLRNLGEAIGDHAALDHAASPASYAQLLLEFAALPRPTLIGVAMARPNTISQRIERLLNDSTFRQAFGGGKSRALLAVLIVPVAIFAVTALVRVEAAGVAQAQAPVSTPSPSGTASAPAAAESAVPADAPQVPDAAQAAGAGNSSGAGTSSGADSALQPLPPQAPAVPGKAGQPNVPNPPELLIETDGPNPPDFSKLIILDNQAQIRAKVDAQVKAQMKAQVQAQVMAAGTYKLLQDAKVIELNGPDGGHSSYSFVMSDSGDSYAIVSGPDTKMVFSGDWHGARTEDIEKARKMAHGKFLWFAHDGKSYIVEDPTVIAQIEEMYKPMEALGRQEAELGKREEELGKQEGDLGKQVELAKITAPDISKEMAEVTAAMTKLQSEMGKEINREELAQVQGKLAELQGKLGALQGEFAFKNSDFYFKRGQMAADQGKLGAEQGRLGAEQGRLAREADRKVKGIIDESLSNGKARPVQ